MLVAKLITYLNNSFNSKEFKLSKGGLQIASFGPTNFFDQRSNPQKKGKTKAKANKYSC